MLCCKCSSHLLHLIPFQLLSLALRASLPVPRAKHRVNLGWREGGGGAGCAGQCRDLVTSGGTGRGAHGPPAAPLPPPGPAGSGTPKLPRGNVVVPEPSAVGRTSPRRAGSCSLGRQKLRTRGHRPRSAPSPHSSSSCGRMGRGGCSLGPLGRSTQPEHPLSPPPRQRGWQALFLAVRRAQQLLSKKGRAAIVTMTGTCLPQPAPQERCGARNAGWQRQNGCRDKKWGFMEGETWAKLAVFNCKLQETEGKVVDATCPDFSKTFDNCSYGCCQITSDQLGCQHRHMDNTQERRERRTAGPAAGEQPGATRETLGAFHNPWCRREHAGGGQRTATAAQGQRGRWLRSPAGPRPQAPSGPELLRDLCHGPGTRPRHGWEWGSCGGGAQHRAARCPGPGRELWGTAKPPADGLSGAGGSEAAPGPSNTHTSPAHLVYFTYISVIC